MKKYTILAIYAAFQTSACTPSSKPNSGGTAGETATTTAGGPSLATTGGGVIIPPGYSGTDADYPTGVTANPVAGGQPIDDGVIPTPNRTDWLSIKANQFVDASGKVWQGRGVTMHDTRSCDYCTSVAPNVPEIKRRIDVAVRDWHVNFIRLLLQSFSAAAYSDGSNNDRVQWKTLMDDPNYFHDIREIVEYIGTKPGVYVELSLWKDPNFTTSTNPSVAQAGLPTPGTDAEMAKLAGVFINDAHVMFGVANEPEQYTDALEPACVSAMSASVQAIRAVEDAAKGKHHIVVVQGTEGWARLVAYYVTHPVAGDNVAYETHPYTAAANFDSTFLTPGKTLPIVVGEFAPATTANMTLADCQTLMVQADKNNIPWVAWDFHEDCASNSSNNMLLQPPATRGCVYGASLVPTVWGSAVLNYIISKQ